MDTDKFDSEKKLSPVFILYEPYSSSLLKKKKKINKIQSASLPFLLSSHCHRHHCHPFATATANVITAPPSPPLSQPPVSLQQLASPPPPLPLLLLLLLYSVFLHTRFYNDNDDADDS